MRGRSPLPVIAVSIGCPSGVGPEVALRAAAQVRDAHIVLVGDRGVIERAARVVGVAKKRLVDIDLRSLGKSSGKRAVSAASDAPSVRGEGALASRAIGVLAGASAVPIARAPFGRPSRDAGRAQLSWIDEATDLVTSGAADALVTGPVSKSAIASSSEAARKFRGHTEHLAERCGAREVIMAFWSEELTVALVTTHLAIARVPAAITPRAVASSIYWTADLARRLGKKKPHIVVTGLNPHAGEDGLLGTDEPKNIAPGIGLARQRIARARHAATISGPIGAETAIRYAHAGRYDAVVAMYHDQATIPMKLVGFGEAVNVTLGLPIIRTSVDHGTGYDIAGKGKADARGMKGAIDLAVRLAKSP